MPPPLGRNYCALLLRGVRPIETFKQWIFSLPSDPKWDHSLFLYLGRDNTMCSNATDAHIQQYLRLTSIGNCAHPKECLCVTTIVAAIAVLTEFPCAPAHVSHYLSHSGKGTDIYLDSILVKDGGNRFIAGSSSPGEGVTVCGLLVRTAWNDSLHQQFYTHTHTHTHTRHTRHTRHTHTRHTRLTH